MSVLAFQMALAGVEQSISVLITPSSINAASGTCPLTSQAATANVEGGRLPYTYAWTLESGSPGITIDNPTSPSTTFSVNGPGSRIGTFRCAVTDANGFTKSDTMSVDMECGGN